jgi:hypothetical protein
MRIIGALLLGAALVARDRGAGDTREAHFFQWHQQPKVDATTPSTDN